MHDYYYHSPASLPLSPQVVHTKKYQISDRLAQIFSNIKFWTQPLYTVGGVGLKKTIKENPLTKVNFQIHRILFSCTVDWSKRNKWQCQPPPLILRSHSFHTYYNCTRPASNQKLKLGAWTIQPFSRASKQGN